MIDILKLLDGDKEAKPPRPSARQCSFRTPDPIGDLKSFLLLDPKEIRDTANGLLATIVAWKNAWYEQRAATANNYWNGYNYFAELTRRFLVGDKLSVEQRLPDLLTELGQMAQLPNNAGWVMSTETRSKLIAAGWELVKRSNVMNPPKEGYDLERRIEEWRNNKLTQTNP